MVYQGLGVYREPVQRHSAAAQPQSFGALPREAALCSLPSLDGIPYAQRSSDTGMHLSGLTRAGCLLPPGCLAI